MSTQVRAYMNFLASLANDAKDEQLQSFIDERAQFLLLGKSDMMSKCNGAIDSVFDELDSLAKTLEEEQIAEESVKLAEDAAAVAAIWSFGLSTAAYIALAITEAALKAEIKKKEDDLNSHVRDADTNISDKMGGCCSQFINLYKSNNTLIATLNPTGLTPHTGRQFLYTFMDFLSRNGGVGLVNFKKYLNAVDTTLKNYSTDFDKVCQILDEFTLSNDQSKDKVKEALDKMDGCGIDPPALEIIRGISFCVWVYKLKVSATTIRAGAAEANVPTTEFEGSVFENMDAVEAFSGALTIGLSIADAFLSVYNIVKTVERYQQTVSTFRDARGKYKQFYQNIYDSSVSYGNNSA